MKEKIEHFYLQIEFFNFKENRDIIDKIEEKFKDKKVKTNPHSVGNASCHCTGREFIINYGENVLEELIKEISLSEVRRSNLVMEIKYTNEE